MPPKTEFRDYVLEQFSALGGVSARGMFGGFGLYRDGVMFALIADDVLYLKVDDFNRPMFEARGSKPFTYEKAKGKQAVMSYYEVPAEVLEEPDMLKEWAEPSCVIAKRAAKKKKPKS